MIAEPMGEVAQQFMTLGAAVVQEIAKLKLKPRNSVRWGLNCHAPAFKHTTVLTAGPHLHVSVSLSD